MSTPFASTNLFSGMGSRDSSSTSTAAASSTTFTPPLGLRQRHTAAFPSTSTAPPLAASAAAGASRSDENANPNSVRDNVASNSSSSSKVPVPPPRISLATSGKFHPRRSAGAINNSRQSSSNAAENNNNRSTNSEKTTNHPAAIVPLAFAEKKNEDEDLSLWVIGYGYRNEAHFRGLYQRLEKCGTITSRRGGLACFGEETTNSNNDTGDNWVAIRYESALCAQKALCQHGNFVSVGGSTMVMGVMALTDSMEVAVQLLGSGSVGGSDSGLLSTSRESGGDVRLIGQRRTEEDALRISDDEQRGVEETMDDEMKSSIDSFCGKVMAWFFMWDT